MIVCLTPFSSSTRPTPHHTNQLTRQASYFCRRKFLLVNGTHTTLAFMTLCLKQPRRSPNEVGGADGGVVWVGGWIRLWTPPHPFHHIRSGSDKCDMDGWYRWLDQSYSAIEPPPPLKICLYPMV